MSPGERAATIVADIPRDPAWFDSGDLRRLIAKEIGAAMEESRAAVIAEIRKLARETTAGGRTIYGDSGKVAELINAVAETLERFPAPVPVANIDDHRPHLVQAIRCNCGRSWTAVFPITATRLKCPGCSAAVEADKPPCGLAYFFKGEQVSGPCTLRRGHEGDCQHEPTYLRD